MTDNVAQIELTGLHLASCQVLRTLRLVPVLRRRPSVDFRIEKRSYGDDFAQVSLERGHEDPGLKYFAYIPHAFVAQWSGDGSPVVSCGVQVRRRRNKKGPAGVRMLKRILRREAGDRIRMLPLHMALEGFLALHFGGPDVAWEEYSRQALAYGLDPRTEWAMSGDFVPGLEEALRVFEIHDDQVGMLLFVGDSLAATFVVSHPDDYRALHRTLLADCYAEMLYYHGIYGAAEPLTYELDERNIESVSDLRAAATSMRRQWDGVYEQMASGVFGAPVRQQSIYKAGPFSVNRFITELDPAAENHIGESVTRADGSLEYLKTFRLSAAQTRRAYLLSILAKHEWDFRAAAESLGQSREELLLRVKKAGFGYLLHDHVIEEAQKKRFGHGKTEWV